FSIGKISSLLKEQKNIRSEIFETSLPTIPTVNITGIENNKLVGSVKGNVRVFIDSKMILPDINGHIEHDANSFFENIIPIKIPKGIQYIASKRGKYFYHVKSSQGERIIPKNRIYFQNSNDAEKAGYIKK
ncbi:MAG: hypothetical protein KAS32_21595, partial [Candidatus Peribacteraceae bacterium]|nr:hypothetical protein [Candidatus Peribacteraceae bacterium]